MGAEVTTLALSLLKACTDAAAQCGPWVGRGDKEAADQAAVEAMRSTLASVPGHGVVVIGEGEKDQAPMLFAGEEVGTGRGPRFDLAVDPLEGTSLCARGAPGAVTVLAAAPGGSLTVPPGFYMDKLVVGAAAAGSLDIDAPIEDNLRAVASALAVGVTELRVAVLDKPRHGSLIEEVRRVGAKVIEVPEGDVMAGLAALVPGWGVDFAVGIGGAPEGVITACSVRLLGGGMQARPAPQGDEERQEVERHGALGRRYDVVDLCPGSDVVFAASGVTGSDTLDGVGVTADGTIQVSSLLITPENGVMRVVSPA
ncbi:MAG: class II fructose-bisphosphatase [Actinomycetota bacterium]|nr:class II fructose-bisphosphatase [Actinomycetota bacterium]